VLLDIPDSSLESIVDRLLDKMIIDNDQETVTRSEIKSSIFADEARTRLIEKLQVYIKKIIYIKYLI
jgi:hypothetical protein